MELQMEILEDDSVYKHITGLCEKFAVGLYKDSVCKQKVIKNLRRLAFNKLLFFRHMLHNNDEDIESNIGFLVPDIYLKIHNLRMQTFYNSTKENQLNVHKMLERLQEIAGGNPGIASVLQLLLLLADTKVSDDCDDDVPLFGLDLRRCTSLGLRRHYTSPYAILPDSAFEFENCPLNINPFVPQYKLSKRLNLTYPFEENPGTGLSSHFSCTTINSEKRSGPFHKNLSDEDFESTNWSFPKQRPASSTSVHPDEGYGTPDNDHIWDVETSKRVTDYWDGSHLEPSSSVRSWMHLGSKDVKPERPFISQSKTSVFRVWRVIRELSICEESDIPSTKLTEVTIESLSHDIKNLMIAIESGTFYFNQKSNSFAMRRGVYISGVTPDTLEQYCQEYIKCANSCHLLKELISQDPKIDGNKSKKGLIFQALSRCVQRYIQCYHGIVLRLPLSQGLVKMNHWVVTLRTQLDFLAKLCCVYPSEEAVTLPHGGALLVYIYDKVTEVVRQDLAYILYYILESCCHVYFKVLERWIFEGVCDDPYEEFFIVARPLKDISYDRLFWTQGFVLNRFLVPGFLKGLENDLFVCGKSVSLLKLSNVNDPLLRCLKRAYPGVNCCLDQDGLDRLFSKCLEFKDVCVTECGSRPRVFCSLTEEEEEAYRISLTKQREKTLERIRKVQEDSKKTKSAYKREIFEELKKSMEDEMARKIKAKQTQLVEEVKMLEIAVELEKTENLRREEEREKLVEYYNSLSDTAEKQRLRAEWKLKRMQLNEVRSEFLQNEQAELQHITSLIPQTAITGGTSINEALAFSSGDFEMPNKTVLVGDRTAVIPVVVADGQNISIVQNENANNSAKEDAIVVLQKKEISVQTELNKIKVLQEEFGLFDDKNTLIDETPCNPRYESDATVEKRFEKEERVQKEWKMLESVMVDANEARQKAVKNRENAFGRDYNIITGELVRSGLECNVVDLPENSVSVDVSTRMFESHVNTVDSIEKDINEASGSVIIESIRDTLDVAIESISISNTSDVAINAVEKKPQSSTVKELKSCYRDLKHIDTLPIIIDIADRIPSVEENVCKVNVKQIDSIQIYSCLQKSVLFPLQTQLTLVNDAILRLFINEHNLVAHFDCIRKYFFLLDGDYGSSLTKNLFSEMQSVKRPSLLLNHLRLNSLLCAAVGNNSDEDLAERLSFRVNQVPTSFHLTDPNALACLSMTYKTHWPLNVIITPAAIAKYDKVFTFVMQLRRASWALEQDVYLLKVTPTATSSQQRQVHLFRHIMAQFLQALQSYVMTTVMDSSWLELKKELDKALTLEALYASHVSYVKKVIFRCLLNKRSMTIYRHLLHLFRIILTFHENLRSDNWTEGSDGELQHSAFPRLCHQYSQFLELSRFLFSYLERLVTSGYLPHLEQLLTLLSCNNFYKTR